MVIFFPFKRLDYSRIKKQSNYWLLVKILKCHCERSEAIWMSDKVLNFRDRFAPRDDMLFDVPERSFSYKIRFAAFANLRHFSLSI